MPITSGVRVFSANFMFIKLDCGTVKSITTSEILNTSPGLSLTIWLVSQFKMSDRFLLINSCFLCSKPPTKFTLESLKDFLTISLQLLDLYSYYPLVLNL